MLVASSSFLVLVAPILSTCIGDPQVLILVPTRELALQTSAIVKEIGKHTGVQCMVRKKKREHDNNV